jgi:hypothetical protein
MQASEAELPVQATATVETETQGNEPGRLRHPVKRREDNEAGRRERRQDGEDGEDGEDSPGGEAEEPSLNGVADDEASEETDASAEENESPDRELDVTL